MTMIFGILFTGQQERETASRPPIPDMLRAASLNGARELQICTPHHALLGGFSPEDVRCLITDEQNGYTYLVGGEFFAAPFSEPVPDRLDSARGKNFLHSLFADDGNVRLRSLDGHFCIVRYCHQSRTMRIINDALGLYPLYMMKAPGWTAFATEYQVLLELGFPRTLDIQFLAEWALYGFGCEGRTPLLDLRSLPPAADVTIYAGNDAPEISYACYDDWNYAIDHSLSLEAAAEAVGSLMQKTLAAFLLDNKVPAMPITGGYDSRLIMACLPDSVRQSMDWVTICSPHLTANKDRDVLIATQIADTFGLKHSVPQSPSALKTLPEEQTDLYESLRPLRLEYGIHGHFSGYLRGLLPDFAAIERDRLSTFRTFFSPDICERAASSFSAITDNRDYGEDENRALKYYLLNNIRCFLNHDHLGGGKWLNPITFFWQPLRAPFGVASLHRQLLRIPARYRRGGLLFLKVMELLDPRMFSLPFTSAPFPPEVTQQLSTPPVKAGMGTDYQAARTPFWTGMLKESLRSGRAAKREIYSGKWLRQANARCIMHAGGERILPAYIRNHWRFQKMVPPMADQHLVKIENWLWKYGDTPEGILGA
ncbi:hypothetical protein N1030_14230 [Desulfovibrio mangrovi]|uniref:hypothetical protein n=1 Tax=Desulfovibrio mangrovi TaxID=2976983 RepID=UPI00224637A3|nr:hypothetical protein [Desulfovibrio mangrovi]UZP66758.1 hypothetical protein N1030_14230 [Desulfovibrio mangrovi]